MLRAGRCRPLALGCGLSSFVAAGRRSVCRVLGCVLEGGGRLVGLSGGIGGLRARFLCWAGGGSRLVWAGSRRVLWEEVSLLALVLLESVDDWED